MSDLKLDTEKYENILKWSFGLAIDSIWLSVCDLYESASFENRKKIFLEFLFKVLSNGKAHLSFGDEFLKSDIPEQIESFRNAWPATEKDMNEYFFYLDKDNESWIPGWLVWVGENNQIIWP